MMTTIIQTMVMRTPPFPKDCVRFVIPGPRLSKPPALASRAVTARSDTQLPSAEAAEATRLRRLREDGRRPLAVNLAEGIALSHMLMRFTGAARRA
jgi:hypothetical protein